MTVSARRHVVGHLHAAHDDVDSVVDLTTQMVEVPSRGGIDPYAPVLEVLAGWLDDHSLSPNELVDRDGKPVGVVCEINGVRPGPRWVLNACVDTAPFGDESRWTHPPTAAVIEDGWMWGRGCADSKAGAAIFCHVGARIAAIRELVTGSLVLLFDADEHTGTFGGARSFFDEPRNANTVDGVLIGYPGMDEVVVGSRGVLRAELRAHGVGGHSGGSKPAANAVVKACDLVAALSAQDPKAHPSPDFSLQPRVSVTAIHGGEGYTITPDLCELNVDVRTTPAFDSSAAHRVIETTVDAVDRRWDGTATTEIAFIQDWPPYVLDETSTLRSSLLRSARMLGIEPATKISGPSNIGNYLATLGIPATAGFGVAYRGLHAVDERIDLATIPTVQAIYHATVADLLDLKRPDQSSRGNS